MFNDRGGRARQKDSGESGVSPTPAELVRKPV